VAQKDATETLNRKGSGKPVVSNHGKEKLDGKRSEKEKKENIQAQTS
jgi:hypothetical protein